MSFSVSFFALIFDRLFHGKWTQNGTLTSSRGPPFWRPFSGIDFGKHFWLTFGSFGSIFVHLGSLSALLGSLSRPFGFFGVTFCSLWLFFGSYYAPLAPFWWLFGTCCSFSRFLLCFLFISRDFAWISADFLPKTAQPLHMIVWTFAFACAHFSEARCGDIAVGNWDPHRAGGARGVLASGAGVLSNLALHLLHFTFLLFPCCFAVFLHVVLLDGVH